MKDLPTLLRPFGQRLPYMPYQSWRDEANCVGEDPSLFEAGHGVGWATVWDRVKHLCEPCPVQQQCQEYGQTQDDMMWGGIAREAGRNVAYTPMKGCGTVTAYKRHISRNERPCGPCRQANRLYRRGVA